MGKKKIQGLIKLQIPAGNANPAPPVGPALGQNGVNIMDFCKAFNDHTSGMQKGMPIPVAITVFADRSFEFVTKKPPASYLIMQAAKLKKGSSEPGKGIIGKISRDKLRKVAEEKIEDMNANDIDAAIAILAGSARSMGLEVEEE